MGNSDGMKSFRPLVAALAALTLAACGGSDDAASTPADDEPVTTEAPDVDLEPEPEPEPAPEPEPEAATEPEAEPTPAADPSCLVGSWLITGEQLTSYFAAIAADITTDGVGGIEFGVIGDVILDLDGSSYVYTADFDLEITIAEFEGFEGTGTSSGTASGTYDVVDGIITTTLGSSDLTVVVDVGGVAMSGSDLANGLLEQAPINEAPFDCDGPTIGFQVSDDASVRHPVTLVPA